MGSLDPCGCTGVSTAASSSAPSAGAPRTGRREPWANATAWSAAASTKSWHCAREQRHNGAQRSTARSAPPPPAVRASGCQGEGGVGSGAVRGWALLLFRTLTLAAQLSLRPQALFPPAPPTPFHRLACRPTTDEAVHLRDAGPPLANVQTGDRYLAPFSPSPPYFLTAPLRPGVCCAAADKPKYNQIGEKGGCRTSDKKEPSHYGTRIKEATGCKVRPTCVSAACGWPDEILRFFFLPSPSPSP